MSQNKDQQPKAETQEKPKQEQPKQEQPKQETKVKKTEPKGFTPKKKNEGHWHLEVENIEHDRLGNKLSKPDVIKLAPKMFEVFKKASYAGYEKVIVMWDADKKESTLEVLVSPDKLKKDRLSSLSAAEVKLKEAQQEIDKIRNELKK